MKFSLNKCLTAFPILLLSAMSLTARAYGAEGTLQTRAVQEYRDYCGRFESVKAKGDIPNAGFRIIEDQIFPVELEGYGQVSFIPAYDTQYRRLALFFAAEDQEVVFKTDRLETNSQRRGSLSQPNEWLAAVSFQDMDNDGLFQKDGAFYRDYRLSEQLNRFGMNKSIRFITSFIRDGYSTEFLYTATTQKELLDNGFQIARDQYHPRRFEKLGRLYVVPGTYRMAEYTVFMVYLVNEEGYIVWSFQPMGDYENLYGLKGISCQDIDGDGLKDIMVSASYSYEGSGGQSVVESGYSVYYQRTAGFYEDTDMKQTIKCTGADTMSGLVERARAYWGWKTGQ